MPKPEPSAAIDTLARTIWGEARGEGKRGMQAVANVIANRVGSPRWWGRSWETVCRKPFQFSCWIESDPNRERMEKVTDANAAFRDALRIAERAVSGKLPDITNRADHYYSTAVPVIPAPKWAIGRKPVAKIGNHIFFRLELTK